MVLKTYSFALQTDSFVALEMRQADLYQQAYDVSGSSFQIKKGRALKERGLLILVARLLYRQTHLGTVNEAARHRRYCVGVGARAGVRLGWIGRCGRR